MKYGLLQPDGTVQPTTDRDAAWSQDCVIKQEFFKDHFISTVFLPLDHNFRGPKSLHFETFVFRATRHQVKNWSERWGRRCHTKEEALAAHQRAKDWARGRT